MYKLSQNSNVIIRLSDNACIPVAMENADYREYLQWVALGNTAIPAEPAANPRISEIYRRLDHIDLESIRGLRAVRLNRGQPADTTKLQTLDDEAIALRAELATL